MKKVANIIVECACAEHENESKREWRTGPNQEIPQSGLGARASVSWKTKGLIPDLLFAFHTRKPLGCHHTDNINSQTGNWVKDSTDSSTLWLYLAWCLTHCMRTCWFARRRPRANCHPCADLSLGRGCPDGTVLYWWGRCSSEKGKASRVSYYIWTRYR